MRQTYDAGDGVTNLAVAMYLYERMCRNARISVCSSTSDSPPCPWMQCPLPRPLCVPFSRPMHRSMGDGRARRARPRLPMLRIIRVMRGSATTDRFTFPGWRSGPGTGSALPSTVSHLSARSRNRLPTNGLRRKQDQTFPKLPQFHPFPRGCGSIACSDFHSRENPIPPKIPTIQSLFAIARAVPLGTWGQRDVL
jgi:hypothetical protein